MDMQLPDIGMMEAEDPETGRKMWINTSDIVARQNYQTVFFDHTEYCKNVFLRSGSDLLHIRTGDDYVKVLQKFFIGRNK